MNTLLKNYDNELENKTNLTFCKYLLFDNRLINYRFIRTEAIEEFTAKFAPFDFFKKNKVAQHEDAIEALSRNGLLISSIENPNKEEQLAAILNAPDAIKYIKFPTPEVQMMAVKMDINLFTDIKTPSMTCLKYMIDYDYTSINKMGTLPEPILLELLAIDPRIYRNLPNTIDTEAIILKYACESYVRTGTFHFLNFLATRGQYGHLRGIIKKSIKALTQ